MAYTPTKLCQATVTTSIATYYTVPAGKTAIVKQVLIVNANTSATNVGVFRTPSGVSASSNHLVIPHVAVPPYDFLLLDVSWVMSAGDFLSAIKTGATEVYLNADGIIYP